jgi:exopolysaccharide production protein ExoQ
MLLGGSLRLTPLRPVEFLLLVVAIGATMFPTAGPLGAFAIVGGVGGVGLLRRDVAMRSIRWLPLLAYPLLQVASMVWSLDRSVTLRYSLELFLTAYLGLLCVLALGPEDALKAIFVASVAMVGISILSGVRGHYSASGLVLVGVEGSKNNMSYTAQLAAQACLGMLLLRAHPLWKLAAAAAFLPCFYVAVAVHAATGTISALVGLGLFAGVFLTSKAPRGVRLWLVLSALVALACAVLLRDELAALANDALFRLLNKDATLTGRTELWRQAEGFIQARPLLGRGYKEIWIGQSADTIGLLRWAGVADGREFYFHNSYLEAGVDSGFVGIGVLSLTLLAITYGLTRRFIEGLTPAQQFFAIMFALLLLRSFTETLMQPFSIAPCLIYIAGVCAFAGRRGEASQGLPASPTAMPGVVTA